VTFKLKDVDWTKILGRKSPVEKLVEEAEVITEKVRHRAKGKKNDGKRIQHTG
jgi:hypothetical protein